MGVFEAGTGRQQRASAHCRAQLPSWGHTKAWHAFKAWHLLLGPLHPALLYSQHMEGRAPRKQV